MFEGLTAYDGSNYWGQIVLHNTTRSNTRKIVGVDIGNNVITTTSSTDDWADNDVITCQSQTNTQAGYFDIDLSDFIASTDAGAFFHLGYSDKENNYDASRYVFVHPYTSYDAGKRVWLSADVALESNNLAFLMATTSQKITMWFGSGNVDASMNIAVMGRVEYADT